MNTKQESLMLLKHGTQPCGLSPRSILQTAERDIWAKGENARRRAHRKKMKSEGLPTRGHCDPQMPFAFAAKHVRKATTAAELLELALGDTVEGVKTGKLDTVRIYKSPSTLFQALQLAKSNANAASKDPTP